MNKKKRIITITLAIMLAVSIFVVIDDIPDGVNAAYTKTYTTLKTYDLGSKNHGYYLVPDAEGKYPVLFLFHGADEYSSNADIYKNNALATLNKWIALGYMDPMIVIMPEVEMETSTDSWAISGNQCFVTKGRFQTILDNLKSGYFTDKVDTSKKVSVSGFSMGGAISLYIGAKYPDEVLNIGAASPSWCFYQVSNGANVGWIGKKENIQFTKDSNAHFLIGYGTQEDWQFSDNATRYIKTYNEVRGDNPNDFKLYNTYKDGHTWNTFRREIFSFVYYMKFDQLPDAATIEEACANSNLDYSTGQPSTQQQNTEQQTTEQTTTEQKSNPENPSAQQITTEQQTVEQTTEQPSSQQSTSEEQTKEQKDSGKDNRNDLDTSDKDSESNLSNSNSSTSNGSGSSESNSESSHSSSTFSHKNEWYDGKWYNADGSQTYKPTMSWKYNGIGWWIEDTSGWYPTGMWQKIDGTWYYFNDEGYMASGEWVNGYWINYDGSWTYESIGSWRYGSGGWWYGDTSGWYARGWQKIDGYWYYFGGDGWMVTNQYVDGYYIGPDGAWR